MISQAVASALATEKGDFARFKGLNPVKVCFADIKYFPPFPFPSIGDYVPEGYIEIGSYSCDSTGEGREGEPAHTHEHLIDLITDLTLKHGALYWAITEEGECQLYVTAFRKSA